MFPTALFGGKTSTRTTLKAFMDSTFQGPQQVFFSLGGGVVRELGESQEEMSFGYQECTWTQEGPEQIFVFPLMPFWSSH